mmetsp:Transcript_20267/g.50676  ORF Transcript_20267/g.50676 Transcript_20267/m.50676 type:complete len:245 (-) Transcript_20267:410-1144(-)
MLDHWAIAPRLGEKVLLELCLLPALVDEKVFLPLGKQEMQLLALRAHLFLDLLCLCELRLCLVKHPPDPLLLLPPHPLSLLESVHLLLDATHAGLPLSNLCLKSILGLLLLGHVAVKLGLQVAKLALELRKVDLPRLRLLLGASEGCVKLLLPLLAGSHLHLQLPPRLLALVQHVLKLHSLLRRPPLDRVNLLDVPHARHLVVVQQRPRPLKLIPTDGKLALQLPNPAPEARNLTVVCLSNRNG